MAKQLIQATAPEAPQYGQGDIVTNDDGDRMQLSGDKWVPIERALTPEQQQLSQVSPLEAMGLAAVERGRSLYGGAQQLLAGVPDAAPDLAQQGAAMRQSAQDRMRGIEQGNPNAAMVGGFLPDVAAGLGVAALTGGAGLPVVLGAEAALGGAMGAATTPETPWQGAAIGGGAALAGVGLGTLAGRMAGRVMGAIDEAVKPAATQGSYLPGLMRPDELSSYGVQLTPGRQALIGATDDKAYAAAQELMRREDMMRGLPSAIPGAKQVQGMLDQSETAMTRATQRQLGLPENTLMTNKVLGDNLEQLGKQYDDIAGRAGKVVVDDVVRADMREALDAASDASRSIMERKIRTFEELADKHGGAIPAEAFRTEMSNLNRLIRKTSDYVKASELEELQKALTEGLSNSLSAADRQALQDTNRKYALSMTLLKPGVTSQGRVAEGAFMRNWRGSRPARVKNAQNDPLTRIAETLTYVNSNQAVPSKTSIRQWALGGLDQKTGGLATPVAAGLAGAGVMGLLGK